MNLYLEGGGDRDDLHSKWRRAFSAFFEKAGVKKRPRVVVCGSRAMAFDRFRSAHLRQEACGLLVDSEGPVADGASFRKHLQDRDKWSMPDAVRDEQLHLFVQVMESWFLADAEACAERFGKGFRKQDLQVSRPVESIGKQELYRALANAFRNVTAGSYSKGQHSHELIERLDPAKVERACPAAKRLLEWLRSGAE